MNQPQPEGIEITPIAILAAVLFYARKSQTVKIKTDGSEEPVEALVNCVGIEQTDDAVVAVIKVDKIIHFAQNAYNFQLRTDKGVAIISFERRVFGGADLYAANGEQIPKESSTIQGLLNRFLRGADDKDKK